MGNWLYYGFVRFYNQGRVYRTVFRKFIEEKDAADPESYHYLCSWHPEGYSEAPVAFGEIPRFSYRSPSVPDEIVQAGLDLILLLAFFLVAAIMAIVSLIRYDVR